MPFYYINIAKKCSKIHIFQKNCLFGAKIAFYPKTKVVPKTLSYCKSDKKKSIFKIYYFGGGSVGSQNWQKSPKLPYSCTPSNRLKNLFLKNKFFHLFHNSSKFLEQLLFWGKMHFFNPKRQFFQKHGFWCIFWLNFYNKSPVY